MKFSTAKWVTVILFAIGAVSISTYFYLDEIDMMIPLLVVIIKPLMMVTLFPAVFLLLANILASTRKQERITKQNFQNAFVILACLIAYRVLVKST